MTAPTDAVRAHALTLPSAELPAYVYDLAALREHAAFVRAALSERVELYYAAKANPEPEILATLSPYVHGYEVASGGELAHVGNAVPGRPLAFGGPGKTPAEIAAALDQGVARFHVESAHELRVLAELSARRAPDARVGILLRFNLPCRAACWRAAPWPWGDVPPRLASTRPRPKRSSASWVAACTRSLNCAACTPTWPADLRPRSWWPSPSPWLPGPKRWPHDTGFPRRGQRGWWHECRLHNG